MTSFLVMAAGALFRGYQPEQSHSWLGFGELQWRLNLGVPVVVVTVIGDSLTANASVISLLVGLESTPDQARRSRRKRVELLGPYLIKNLAAKWTPDQPQDEERYVLFLSALAGPDADMSYLYDVLIPCLSTSQVCIWAHQANGELESESASTFLVNELHRIRCGIGREADTLVFADILTDVRIFSYAQQTSRSQHQDGIRSVTIRRFRHQCDDYHGLCNIAELKCCSHLWLLPIFHPEVLPRAQADPDYQGNLRFVACQFLSILNHFPQPSHADYERALELFRSVYRNQRITRNQLVSLVTVTPSEMLVDDSALSEYSAELNRQGEKILAKAKWEIEAKFATLEFTLNLETPSDSDLCPETIVSDVFDRFKELPRHDHFMMRCQHEYYLADIRRLLTSEALHRAERYRAELSERQKRYITNYLHLDATSLTRMARLVAYMNIKGGSNPSEFPQKAIEKLQARLDKLALELRLNAQDVTYYKFQIVEIVRRVIGDAIVRETEWWGERAKSL